MILYEQEVTKDAVGNASAANTTNVTTLAALMGEGVDPTLTTAIKADRHHKSPQSSQSSSTWDESSDDDDSDIDNYQEKPRIMIDESWPNTTTDEEETKISEHHHHHRRMMANNDDVGYDYDDGQSYDDRQEQEEEEEGLSILPVLPLKVNDTTSTFHDNSNAILQQVESSSEAVIDNKSGRHDNKGCFLQSKNSSSEVQQQNSSTSPYSSFDFPSLRTSPFTDPIMNNGPHSNPCKRSSRSLWKDNELNETVTISSSSSLAMSSLWYRMCTAEARPRLHMLRNKPSTRMAASVGNDARDVEGATTLEMAVNDSAQVVSIKGQQQQQQLADFKLFWTSLAVETA